MEDPEAAAESQLTSGDHQLLSGALDYKHKTCEQVMTALNNVHMVELHDRLNFQTMLNIYRQGFTRVPVYDTERDNIVGILFVKDLILVDPDDEIEVATILSFHGKDVGRIEKGVTLDVVFNKFKVTHKHMYFVSQNGEDGSEQLIGVITLEDVLEELINDEIVDESDNYKDMNQKTTTRLGKEKRELQLAFLEMFRHKHFESSALTDGEVTAITTFLRNNVDEFSLIGEHGNILKNLVLKAEVLDVEEVFASRDSRQEFAGDSDGNASDSGVDDLHTPSRPRRVGPSSLYVAGKPADFCLLIIQGRLLVTSGSEEFESEIGPWNTLGLRALRCDPSGPEGPYIPDFTAMGSDPEHECRVLKIKRSDYIAAFQLSQLRFSSSLTDRLSKPEEASDRQ